MHNNTPFFSQLRHNNQLQQPHEPQTRYQRAPRTDNRTYGSRPYSENRVRSQSPRRYRSPSPRRRRSRSPERRNQQRRPPASRTKQDFHHSATGTSHSACAVCLGRHPHMVRDCKATSTWDGNHPATSKRLNGELYLRSDDARLCVDWQRISSCASTKHDSCHRCSGCASPGHGAQNCPRAQKA